TKDTMVAIWAQQAQLARPSSFIIRMNNNRAKNRAAFTSLDRAFIMFPIVISNQLLRINLSIWGVSRLFLAMQGDGLQDYCFSFSRDRIAMFVFMLYNP